MDDMVEKMTHIESNQPDRSRVSPRLHPRRVEAAQQPFAAKITNRPSGSCRHPEDLLTSSEFAAEIHSSPRTVESWRLRGTGPPFIRVGGRRVLYRWRDVLEYLEGRRFSSTSEEQAA
jgi:hypothetical protein